MAHTTENWQTWHKKLGHVSLEGLKNLLHKDLVDSDGFNVDEQSPEFECDACIQAKHSCAPFPKEADSWAEHPGELTHTDVWGPACIEDIGRAKYYISFINNYTRRCTVQFMKHKDETSTKVQQYLTYIETHWDIKPKHLHANNGTEYVNQSLLTWCRDHGIETKLTAPYSPSQNGVAKRFNRTLLELLRAMIIAQNIPKFLWPEVITHATYIRNRLYTHANDDATPKGQWSNKRPNISHLHELGSPVWILREEPKLSKLDPKSIKQMFIGYLDGLKAIKYYDACLCQVKVSRNYQFPKEYTDSHTPTPIVQCEGKLGGTNMLYSNVNYDPSEGQPTTSTLERKHEAKPLRWSTWPKVTHDYSKLNDPLLDLEDILDNDNDKDEHMSSAEATYQAFTKTHLGRGDPKSLREAKELPK